VRGLNGGRALAGLARTDADDYISPLIVSTAATLRPTPGAVHIPVAGGVLELDVRHGDWALDALCAFAARRNRRRAFLIVSKVLGRHIPARPSLMRAAMRDLAGLVPAGLPGPILVVGLAETAVCLGQGVHEELAGRLGRDAAFVHSTRQMRPLPLLARFEEPHSHAAQHLLYRSESVDFGAIRSLVLVDDEVSTGTTLANLAGALVAALPQVEEIAVATLTDWSGASGWLERMPRPASCVSLLAGALRWTGGPALAEDPETLSGDGQFGSLAGGHATFALPDAGALALGPAQRLRIVGTGEFTYPPFLLAERLERAGHDVVVQATSRSPVLAGGPIGHVLRFRDNYGAAVSNYLYNAGRGDGRRTIVCHETPPGSIDPRLVAALDADCLFFEGGGPCAP
jgi:hypothetical protein